MTSILMMRNIEISWWDDYINGYPILVDISGKINGITIVVSLLDMHINGEWMIQSKGILQLEISG